MKFSTVLISLSLNALSALAASALTTIGHQSAQIVSSSSGHSSVIPKTHDLKIVAPTHSAVSSSKDSNLPPYVAGSDDSLVETKLAIEAFMKNVASVALAAADHQDSKAESLTLFSFHNAVMAILEHLALIDWLSLLHGHIDWDMILRLINVLLDTHKERLRMFITFLDHIIRLFVPHKGEESDLEESSEFEKWLAAIAPENSPVKESPDGKLQVPMPAS